jgi:hypothetical protein
LNSLISYPDDLDLKIINLEPAIMTEYKEKSIGLWLPDNRRILRMPTTTNGTISRLVRLFSFPYHWEPSTGNIYYVPDEKTKIKVIPGVSYLISYHRIMAIPCFDNDQLTYHRLPSIAEINDTGLAYKRLIDGSMHYVCSNCAIDVLQASRAMFELSLPRLPGEIFDCSYCHISYSATP